VVLDRIHLLEFGHVDSAESSRLALWLSYSSILDVTRRAICLSLGYKVGFDDGGLLSELVHHPLRIAAQLGVGGFSSYSKRKGRRLRRASF
jgi:hypothetical protein